MAMIEAPLTKKEQGRECEERHYLYKYSDVAKGTEALLDKYANDGIKEIEDTKVLQLKEKFRRLAAPENSQSLWW